MGEHFRKRREVRLSVVGLRERKGKEKSEVVAVVAGWGWREREERIK